MTQPFSPGDTDFPASRPLRKEVFQKKFWNEDIGAPDYNLIPYTTFKLSPWALYLWDPHRHVYYNEMLKPISSVQPRFVLAWTTKPATFTSRQIAVLESIYFHHPTAQVVIYSNSLSVDHAPFSHYVYLGYSLTIQTYSSEYLGTKLREIEMVRPEYKDIVEQVLKWMHKWNEWERGKYFYSHVTDLMRFIALARYGGTWMDFDAIVVRSFDGYRNAVGRDVAGTVDSVCPWCLGSGIAPWDIYLAPGVLINWDQYHPTLMEAMKFGFNSYTYTPDCFNCVGPKAMTVAYTLSGSSSWILQKNDNFYSYDEYTRSKFGGDVGWNRRGEEGSTRTKHPNDNVHVLESFQLYPVRWNQVADYAKQDFAHTNVFNALRSTVLSFHLFGHMTSKLTFEKDSLLEHVVGAFRITDETQDDVLSINAPTYIAVLAPQTNRNAQVLDGISLKLRSWDRIALAPSYDVHIQSTSCAISFAQDSTTPSSTLTKSGTYKELQGALSSMLWHTDSSLCSSTHRGELLISSPSTSIVTKIQVVHINDLLTITLQTFGNDEQLDIIIDTIRSQLPEITIYVTNDGPYGKHPQYTNADLDPNVHFVRVNFDSGIGYKRTAMMKKVNTPYVMVMDDNKSFGPYSDVLRWLVLSMDGNVDLSLCDMQHMSAVTAMVSSEVGALASISRPYLVKATALKKVEWNVALKVDADLDVFKRALSSGLKVVKMGGIGFLPLTSQVNPNNPWHLWFQQNANRTEKNSKCTTGTLDNDCDACDDTHAGFLCAQCALYHYGPTCLPCDCEDGLICRATLLGDGACQTRTSLMLSSLAFNLGWFAVLTFVGMVVASVCSKFNKKGKIDDYIK